MHAYLTGLGDFEKDAYSEEDPFIVWIFFLLATFIVQLVFMNLLIALMTDAYVNIMAIKEQSTMKELCAMMHDHIWMIEIAGTFEHSRYILSLTPDNDKPTGSAIERQISVLEELMQDKADQSNNKILRELQQLREDVDGNSKVLRELLQIKDLKEEIGVMVDEAKKKAEEEKTA